jgi:hypothetical protein
LFTTVAFVVSFIGFGFSAFAFYNSTEWVKSRKIKRNSVRLVAARSVLVWEQLLTVAECLSTNEVLDPYLFPSYQRNIQRLEEALDGAFAVGLFDDLIGARENALTLYTAFVQSLVAMETQRLQNDDLNEWIKEHFTMGMVRLLDQLISCHSYSLPEDMRSRLDKKVSKLRELAWTYCNRPLIAV